MYQRKWFKEKQLSPENWKQELRQCATSWSQLDKSGRDAFEAEAAFEQGQREEAMLQPFQSKGDIARKESKLGLAAYDAAAGLSRKSLKSVSRARVQATYAGFRGTQDWAEWNGGLASSEGCLKLDLINLDMVDEDIGKQWSDVTRKPVDKTLWTEERVEECKHDVCKGLFGICSKMPHVKLAASFVSAMHAHIASGCLAWF